MAKNNKVVGTFTKVTRVFPGCFKRIPWNKPVPGVAGWCTLIVAGLAAAAVMAYFWMV